MLNWEMGGEELFETILVTVFSCLSAFRSGHLSATARHNIQLLKTLRM